MQLHAYRLSRSRLPSFCGPSLRWLAETASCRRGAGSGSAVLTARSSDNACLANCSGVSAAAAHAVCSQQRCKAPDSSTQVAWTKGVDTYATLAASIHHNLSRLSSCNTNTKAGVGRYACLPGRLLRRPCGSQVCRGRCCVKHPARCGSVCMLACVNVLWRTVKQTEI